MPRQTPDPETIADIFCYLPDPEARAALEKYRAAFEQFNPPVDTQRNYTCMWPKDHQDWMKQNEPKRYWDGLFFFGTTATATPYSFMLSSHMLGNYNKWL